jgi:4a-hydroxytetrahydrobiopterin dehydratase
MAKLTDEEVRSLLTTMHGWRSLSDAFLKEFSFRGFRDAISFVNRVAELAIAAAHHPVLEILF